MLDPVCEIDDIGAVDELFEDDGRLDIDALLLEAASLELGGNEGGADDVGGGDAGVEEVVGGVVVVVVVGGGGGGGGEEEEEEVAGARISMLPVV